MATGGIWLIYALGGGWGHLTRAAALARAARHKVRILTNSPYATQVARASPELELVILDASLSTEATRKRAVQEIESAAPECLIVDTFPRGLGGELARVLGVRAAINVLVHRDLAPRYVAEAGLSGFVRANYGLVLIPGQDEAGAFSGLPAAVITEPWLVRDPPVRRGTRRVRRIIVCAAGYEDELAWYGEVVAHLRRLARKSDVRCVAATCPPGCPRECWVEHWPAMDLYSEADVVIGSAGYNTVAECDACEIPLVAKVWPRKYDRQWLRARRAAKRGRIVIVDKPIEGAEAALRELDRAPRRAAAHRIHNGVYTAVNLVEALNSRRATSLDR